MLRVADWHQWTIRDYSVDELLNMRKEIERIGELLINRSSGMVHFFLKALFFRALRWSQQKFSLPPTEEVFLLGRRYFEEGDKFLEDWQSRFLFTYRSGFSPLPNSNITSDAGWGCSLRVVQMLVAQAMSQVVFGRDWKSSESGNPKEREMVKELFLDSPEATFSLHRMCAKGEQTMKKPVGTWYGPTTAAKVAHQVLLDRPAKYLQTCLFSDGVFNPLKVQEMFQVRPVPILIMLCTKLGEGDTLEQFYFPTIRKVFSLQWFQGLCSGDSSTSAHYFVAASKNYCYYLDPHTVRPALIDQVLDCGEWHPGKTSGHGVLSLPYSLLNSSCCFGFLVRNEGELRALLEELKKPPFDEIFDIFSEPLKEATEWAVDEEDESFVLL